MDGPFLKKEGYSVHVAGRTSGMDLITMAQECPVVIVGVPIGVTEEVIRTVGPYMPKESLLMDVTSLKAGPVKAMLRLLPARRSSVFIPSSGPGSKH